MIEQAVCRSDCIRWWHSRWYDPLFHQTEEITQPPHFGLSPTGRVSGKDASPDAVFQLGSFLLGDQAQGKSPSPLISEHHIKVDNRTSNTPQIVIGNASTKDRIQDRKNIRVQEPPNVPIRQRL